MPGSSRDPWGRLHDDLEAAFREDLEEAVIDAARWPVLIVHREGDGAAS